MECLICTEKCNETTRKGVTCAKCSAVACRYCIAYNAKTNTTDICCMACKHPWPRQFLALNMSKQFMSQEYRDIRERLILDRERSLLPATLPYVHSVQRAKGYEVNVREVEEEIKEMEDKEHALQTVFYNTIRTDKEDRKFSNPVRKKHRDDLLAVVKKAARAIVRKKIEKAKLLNRLVHERMFTQRMGRPDPITIGTDNNVIAEEQDVPKKVVTFVTRGHCPATGCNSFIEEGWSCGTCKTKVCSSCMEILPLPPSPLLVGDVLIPVLALPHVCNEDVLATIQVIRKQCKPCPSCRVRVFRVHGCDQMWCTNCNTAFNWTTGEKLVVTQFHNPHYAEWVAKQQRDPASSSSTQRVPQVETTCDNMTHRVLNRAVVESYFPVNSNGVGILVYGDDERRIKAELAHEKGLQLSSMLNTANEILEEERLRNIRDEEELTLRAARIKFVSNETTEMVFKQNIQRIEKRFAKKIEMQYVFSMFATVTRETLVRLCRKELTPQEAIDIIDNELRPFAKRNIDEVAAWYGTKNNVATSYIKLQPTRNLRLLRR